jgi:DNA-binding MarR family transcriptional regulator
MSHEPPRPEIVEQIASDCIAVRVRLINRVVTAIYDEALRPHGLRVSQGNILVAVARRGGARPADIARLLRMEKSTLSRDVEILKAKGWLRSDPPGGGRNQKLHVTQSGIDLLTQSHPAWESAQSEARRLIGEEGVEVLRRVASRLMNGDPAAD